MDPDWADLPALPLSLILDKLLEGLDQSRKKRSLYGIAAEKVYHSQFPVPYSKRCCGSSHGWLATVDSCYVITLLNPFKNVAPIRLPPLNPGLSHKYLFEQNMHKVTLSADPTSNPDDYVVAAVYSQACYIAFIKAGQKFWTYIDKDFLCFTDITFYKGMLYAVGRWNTIVSFNLHYSNDPYGYEEIIPNIVLKGEFDQTYSDRAYLVKSLEGDLLMVRRFLGYQHPYGEDGYSYSNGTESFEVYKLELDVQSGKLLQMSKLNSLEDNVLFLSDSDSISMSASYFSNCLRKDSIHYTDDFYDTTQVLTILAHLIMEYIM
ncbi:uncharacterized protein LOC133306050 [Gastrolobium bilobum]|uniref:uncharacterized protein LOC133306050 n=1 Tax=Gastrolobium bilobum TaxID=150636 RepID=UPI002AAF47BA|nr:uncharacterized protein LOC133306050 [Gastrolobium bilobum]